MNDLCTALADALRKCAEKMPDKFMIDVDELLMVKAALPFPPLVGLDELDCQYSFTLDHMDAVAAALGMEFEVRRYTDIKWFYVLWQGGRMLTGMVLDMFPDKRTASLAALLAIITHALEEK